MLHKLNKLMLNAEQHQFYCTSRACTGRGRRRREGAALQVLFKKRMFRETDETITEPQFVTLSYVQVTRACLRVL